ncbi:2-succinyl-5-enolpyruvyl-6-hydroxy-3-cyclohexene-1-carboxylic-acid synthase [Bradyrhizobium sp. SHOUNA76]|nr:2-succinyl-5-enolpyruvyl-6-hydroxy-3-cyclohexene-1-carboxylic-acid synthase [Bradyrhizobium sp. SHOUNA76]
MGGASSAAASPDSGHPETVRPALVGTTLALNVEWCRTIVAAILRLGVRDVVICPGGRSAAMVFALGEVDGLRRFVQTDERSASFFALGLSRLTGNPVAICTTSGSAVANIVPALTEAEAVGIPLVLLTCDRPKSLRGAGLLQTTEQVAFCAPLLKAVLDLDDPTHEAATRQDLESAVMDLRKFVAAGPNRGPVQINVPLIGVVCSTEAGPPRIDPANEQPRALAMRTIDASVLERSGAAQAHAAMEKLAPRPSLRGLIVCGPEWDLCLEKEQLRTLAQRTGFPVLADAPGSARSLGIPGVVTCGDFIALLPQLPAPDLIVRVGSAPVSERMQSYLQRSARVLRIGRRPVKADFLARNFEQLICPDDAAMQVVCDMLGAGAKVWAESWLGAAEAIRHHLEAQVTASGWSELQVAMETANSTGFRLLHVANSLAIRLLNFVIGPTSDGRIVMANRGVSGIDGTIGTFLGELVACGEPGLLVIGDLAALHDLSALEACIHNRLKGAIVILNNSGAGLFDLIPLDAVDEYPKLVRNSMSIDFEGVARTFKIDYVRCLARKQLRVALDAAAAGEKLVLIEAVLPPKGAKRVLPTFIERLLAAAADKLAAFHV